jgi:hypothetical protein
VRQLLLFVERLLHPAGYVRRKFGMLGGVPGGEQRHRQAAEIADDSTVVAREKRGSCGDESIRERALGSKVLNAKPLNPW